jgi:hypothetical protein
MTSSKAPLLLNSLIAALAVAAGLVLATDSMAPASEEAPAEELQRLVGGLGCGPAVDLSRCAFSFDPRLCEDCPLNHGPIPGGIYFCPQHACSILYCQPLASRPE